VTVSGSLRPHFRTSLLSSEVLDRSRVLDTLVNNLDGMAYRCRPDDNWTMIFVSQGSTALVGFAPDDLIQNRHTSYELITHPEDRAKVRSCILGALEKGERFEIEYRLITRSGQHKWVVERGIAVSDEQGEMVVEGFIQDVSAHRAMIQALEQAELRYRHIFEHASEGIFQTSSDGRYLAANPALALLYGYESPAALMADISDIGRHLYVDTRRRGEFLRLMQTRGEVLNFESEVHRKDGSRIWISENAHVVRDAQGEFICYEGTAQDVSPRKHYQQQLERQANHDLLTGLPNRTLLTDRIEQGIAYAARLGYYMGLVFIDLDHFKFVNDTLGHASGDELLKEIATRLSACLRQSDTVARLGGDEFVLVLHDHYHLSTVISQLERVLAEIGRPVTLATGRELKVGASLGVALYPNDGEDASELLKHADVAMYAAKGRGRNNFQFFTRELNRVAQERLNLEAAMRGALDQNEFQVHYQPKVDHRRRVVGLEALARWFHPTFGTVGPDRFIPIAEETGLILPLTTAVLRQAFAAAHRWNQDREVPLHIAVNLSPRLFLSQDIVSILVALVQEARLSTHLVELEITESVFLGDSDRAVTILHELKSHGFLLAMDDFGTGYSSLSYLRRFPLDIIKIDRSLVTGIELEDDEDVAMIACAAIALGQRLRKTVVAEGVENQAQFDFLRHQGCHEFQGYWMSRPLSETDTTRLLASSGEAPKGASPSPSPSPPPSRA